MAVDIASLVIEVKSDGVVVAKDRLANLTKEGGAAEKSTARLSTSFDNLSRYARLAAEALALYKLAQMAKDAALLAARYETLGVVMRTVGNNAGYTGAQMAGFQAGLEKTGISAIAARQSLVQMAEGQIDFARSSELARVAQNAAVIAQTNSSEGFNRMTVGIATGQSVILHHMGLMTDFEGGYQRLAVTLGKTASELTEHERVQARVNEVIRASVAIEGSYEAAMGTAGKQIQSLNRYTDNLKVAVGAVFSDALLVGVEGLTQGLKTVNGEMSELTAAGKVRTWSEGAVLGLATVADGVMIVYHSLVTMVETGVAGFQQVYYAAKMSAQAMVLDFDGAQASYQKMLASGATWLEAVKQHWANPTQFQDAARALFAARRVAEEENAAKDAAIEQARIAAGVERRGIADREEEQQRYAKRAEAATRELELYQSSASAEIEIAAAKDAIILDSLKAQYDQGLISTQAYLDQKYTLDVAAADRAIQLARTEMEGRQAIYEELAANPYTDANTMAEALSRYEEAKKAYQLADIARSRVENQTLIERVKLMGEEAERAKIKTLMADQFALIQQQIDLDREAGLTEQAFNEQKVLDLQRLQFEYAQRMLDYKRQMVTATGEELALLQQNAELYQSISYQQQQAIEARTYQTASSGGTTGGGGFSLGLTGSRNWADGQTYTVSVPNPNYVDPKIEAAKKEAEAINTATDALMISVRARELEVQGLDDQAAIQRLLDTQAKERQQAEQDKVATGRLITVQTAEYNKLLREQQIKRLTTDTKGFFDTIKTALDSLAQTGKSLANSLLSAEEAIKKTLLGLEFGPQSSGTPAEQYNAAKAALETKYSTAMAGGTAADFAAIPGLVTALLDQSKAYWGGGGQYLADMAAVKDILTTSGAAAGQLGTATGGIVTASTDVTAALQDIAEALTTGNLASLPGLYEVLAAKEETLSGAVTTAQGILATSGGIADTVTQSFTAASPFVGAVTKVETALTGSGADSIKSWLSTVDTSLTSTVTPAVAGIKTALNGASGTTSVADVLTSGAATGYLTGKNDVGKIKSVEISNIYGYGPTQPFTSPNDHWVDWGGKTYKPTTSPTGSTTSYEYYGGGLSKTAASVLPEGLTRQSADQAPTIINIKVVTTDGKLVSEHTIREIAKRSRAGEVVVYADGVAGL